MINFFLKKLSFVLLCLFQQALQTEALCKDVDGHTNGNKTFEFSMISRKNQTGHWITQVSVDKSSQKLPNNWKMNFKSSVSQTGGVQFFHFTGTIIVPPQRSGDYELFPGVGYYKFYTDYKATFDEAVAKCLSDGGHLLIINSESEYRVMQTLFSRNPKVGSSAFVGFHDRFKEGEYITIFGDYLNTTGFLKWAPGDPNNYGGNQNCGCIVRDSFLCDVGCEERQPFFCEYDLSWDDV